MAERREFDLVLWGATGAVGRRVAHHLARRIGSGELRWAIGGRDRARLEAVAAKLPATGRPVEIVLGDSLDQREMSALAARANVVVSTVGPFALYGTALVEACVNAGTQYCDLTGEVQWMREMIDRFDARAKETGARIIHACGHDSIPSDLGVQFLQDEAIASAGGPCRRVATRITQMHGGFSGGTAASFLNAMKLRETDPEFAALSADPYALCPEEARDGPEGRDRMMPLSVTWDVQIAAWTKPYFMAPMNAKVVRRTNALLGHPYGRDFRYEETAATWGGLGGWLAALRGTLFGRCFLKAMAHPATRNLLVRHVLPKSGEGPPAALREAGHYELILVGERPDGEILKAKVVGQGDPGVESTARMLTEAGLCLAEDTAALPVGGGFWTPASGLGHLLRDRVIAHAGVTFDFLGASDPGSETQVGLGAWSAA